MAFRLKLKKPLKGGIRKIARKQLKGAIQHLQNDADQENEAIHEIRVHLKKLRALVRLIRGALGSQYAVENTCFRDIARQLSSRRDAEAALGVLRGLGEWLAGQGEAGAEAALAAGAVHSRMAERQRASKLHAATETQARLADELRVAADRIASWTEKINGFETLAEGLEATYRRARRAMKAAADDPHPETLHEWRKQAKYHRYQINLLEECWPLALEPMSEALRRLSDLLGDDHDLVVLREMLLCEGSQLATDAEREACLNAIEGRRAELREEFEPLGRLIYAEKPKHLRGRLEKYWNIRRADAR
jgi:CHAD domain-containing protein